MQIGSQRLNNNVLVAPMAGVTDRPFRQLCMSLGAGMAVSEMVASDFRLSDNEKSTQRIDHTGELEPKSVQIVGADPVMMSNAARYNVDHGAQIIDINMGCPAKKVCNKLAGSALLQDEALVGQILDAVVASVDVPVTLKIRSGWDSQHRNGPRIARIAEAAGIQAIAVHGRTRACRFAGDAEFETVKRIKQSVNIPVIANGDIDSAECAREVLATTGVDAIMIGRAGQGRPWLYGQIAHYLATGEQLADPPPRRMHDVVHRHLDSLYGFYGHYTGVRIARKHVSWYVGALPGGCALRHDVNSAQTPAAQLSLVARFFDILECDTCLAA